MRLSKKNKTLVIIVGLFLIILFIFLLLPEEEDETLMPDQKEAGEKAQFLKFPIALILDNFKDARPISGIENALFIYEAPVEGDITRLLGIYEQESLPDKIGPIRSARPYFVDWAEEYGAVFIYVGGSPKGLERLRQSQYIPYSINEMSSQGTYFWRDQKRSMPHNTYIFSQAIDSAIEYKGLDNGARKDFKPWKFKSEDKSLILDYAVDEIDSSNLPQLAHIIKIDYREPVIWQYQEEENVYVRYQNGEIFVSENNVGIKVKNVAVQITDIVPYDELDRRTIRTTGTGDALIFEQGMVIKSIWTRQNQTARTIFYDNFGKEIEFVPGTIWINIVSQKHRILY